MSTHDRLPCFAHSLKTLLTNPFAFGSLHSHDCDIHNQRIERLWADVNRVVSEFYKQPFQYMEHYKILDSASEVHLWALHFVYLGRIQRSAREFCQQWNHHTLSFQTMTPLAMWHTGMFLEPNTEFLTQGETED